MSGRTGWIVAEHGDMVGAEVSVNVDDGSILIVKIKTNAVRDREWSVMTEDGEQLVSGKAGGSNEDIVRHALAALDPPVRLLSREEVQARMAAKKKKKEEKKMGKVLMTWDLAPSKSKSKNPPARKDVIDDWLDVLEKEGYKKAAAASTHEKAISCLDAATHKAEDYAQELKMLFEKAISANITAAAKREFVEHCLILTPAIEQCS